MDRVSVGRAFEEKASAFLEEQGVRILERNFRCRQGEIDLVGIHEGCLVFVEVKYRRNERSGMPEEAVGAGKQMKICQVSDYFRIRNKKYQDMQVRYDVVAIGGEEIRWYKNAFFYRNQGGAPIW
ncbi:MAG: YraN family protein [Lachnospiraceae bacterium]|nr:YraN family protein [Lachnospiraceae bacterium]